MAVYGVMGMALALSVSLVVAPAGANCGTHNWRRLLFWCPVLGFYGPFLWNQELGLVSPYHTGLVDSSLQLLCSLILGAPFQPLVLPLLVGTVAFSWHTPELKEANSEELFALPPSSLEHLLSIFSPLSPLRSQSSWTGARCASTTGWTRGRGHGIRLVSGISLWRKINGVISFAARELLSGELVEYELIQTSAARMADAFPAPGRNHVFVPGPVNIPEPVLRAMNRNNEDHRSPAFPKLSKSVIDDVKQIFKSRIGTTFIFPTTGTGAWESALTNTLSPGDKIISFRLGQFSLLWIDQQQRLGFDVDVVDIEWGAGVDLNLLKDKLISDKSHSVKAVAVVHNETSTGVTNDIAGIRRVLDEARHPALLLVDGVSSIGAIEFKQDEWRVDVALTGSQKALSLPTGLGIVCASPKAIEATKTATSRRCFFDWADYIKFYAAGSYWPYTPSIQLLYGLRAALDLLFQEGLDNVVLRHHRLAEATRQAVKAWGLTIATKDPKWNSDTVTAVVVPSHIDSAKIVKIAWAKYNLSLGVGLNKVAGKVFRIGHLGSLNELQLLGALAGVEMVLIDVGVDIKLGSGVAAASAHLLKATPLIASRI